MGPKAMEKRVRPDADTKSWLVWVSLVVCPMLYALIRQAPVHWQYGLASTLHWLLAAAVLGWAFRCLNGPQTMGLHRPAVGFIIFSITITTAVGLQIGLFANEPLANWQYRSIFGLGRWSIVITAITAGYCEELIYRGYMMTALKRNGTHGFIAMVLSSLSFVFFHGMLPIPFMVVGFLISMIWAAIYHTTGVLWLTVFIHGLWDVLLLLTPWGTLFAEQGT